MTNSTSSSIMVTPTVTSIVEPTTLPPIRLTIADAGDISVSKKFTVVDEQLQKTPSATPSKSSFKVIECRNINEVNDVLNNLTNSQYVITGLPHEKGQPGRLLTEGNIIGKDSLQLLELSGRDTSTTISRSLECFTDGDFILIDIDGSDIPFNDIPSKIIELVPEFKGVPMLVRRSSSYGVCVDGNVPETCTTNAHAYIHIKNDDSQLKRIGDILSKRCWLQGIGNHVQISSSGAILIRQLVDKAVFSPERVIYEAPPILSKGVKRVADAPVIIIEGTKAVALSTIPDLTATENLRYESAINDARRKVQPEADRVSIIDTEKAVKKAVDAGIDRTTAIRDVTASKRDSVLYSTQFIHFDLYGWVSVADILDDLLKYDKATGADPLEPEYHGGRNISQFYANLNTKTGEFKPIIFTHAHGGKKYHLEVEPLNSSTSDEIINRLATILEMDSDTLRLRNLIHVSIVERMISSSLFNTSNSKLGFMTDENEYVVFNETDARKTLPRAFGCIYDKQVMNECIKDYTIMIDAVQSVAQKNKLIATFKQIPINAVIDKIKYSNQRKQLEATVDMFAQHSRIDLLPNKAKLVFPYRPISYHLNKVERALKMQVIADYEQHFDLVYEFLDFIVAARFAPDRKNAFLWIHAVSDNGKNFLTDAFKNLGLAVELSVKELEKMFDGNPVGRTMDEFVHAFITVFDEVKTIKGEIKQINNRVMLSAKYESMCSVDVYAKLFLSAENIPSLAGDQGAEQQFVNRFNKFHLKNNLKERDLFIQMGSGLYHSIITEYIGCEIEQRVQSYISKGKVLAEKDAHDYLNTFHGKHNLGKFVHSLDETVNEIADDINALIKRYIDDIQGEDYFDPQSDRNMFDLLRTLVVESDKTGGKIVLRSPDNFVTQFIAAHFSYSSKGSLNYKTSQIVEKLGGCDVYNVSIGGEYRSIRGVLIGES